MPSIAAAAAVEVADHVAHVLLGHGDLDGEDRLEQHGLGAAAASWSASEPAILNAISEESVSWYLPSVSVTRTSTIG